MEKEEAREKNKTETRNANKLSLKFDEFIVIVVCLALTGDIASRINLFWPFFNGFAVETKRWCNHFAKEFFFTRNISIVADFFQFNSYLMHWDATNESCSTPILCKRFCLLTLSCEYMQVNAFVIYLSKGCSRKTDALTQFMINFLLLLASFQEAKPNCEVS